jgi:hypothetical protein
MHEFPRKRTVSAKRFIAGRPEGWFQGETRNVGSKAAVGNFTLLLILSVFCPGKTLDLNVVDENPSISWALRYYVEKHDATISTDLDGVHRSDSLFRRLKMKPSSSSSWSLSKCSFWKIFTGIMKTASFANATQFSKSQWCHSNSKCLG